MIRKAPGYWTLAKSWFAHGMHSLRYLVDKPVKYSEASNLSCLDLYKFTDLDRLAALGSLTAVKAEAGD